MSSSRQSLKKGRDFWGSATWTAIHSMAVTYTPDGAHAYKAFIYSLTQILPCKSCREHLKRNLAEMPIEDYLSNNSDLFLWTYMLHDRVNVQVSREHKVKKVSPPYDDIKAFYFSKLGDECKECKLT